MTDGPEWFAPKRYGFGAGLPIAWQGWAVLGTYGAIILLAGWLLKPSLAAVLAIVVPATMLLMLVTSRTTRCGWRWRWGSRD